MDFYLSLVEKFNISLSINTEDNMLDNHQRFCTKAAMLIANLPKRFNRNIDLNLYFETYETESDIIIFFQALFLENKSVIFDHLNLCIDSEW